MSTVNDWLFKLPGAPASAADPTTVDHLTISYFGNVVFRSSLGGETECDASQVIADVITDPGGGNPSVLASNAGQTPRLNQAELEVLDGYDVFFPALYQALTAKLAPPPPPPPEPEP
jgi:hypothetical protein